MKKDKVTDEQPVAVVVDPMVVPIHVDGEVMDPQDFVWLHAHKYPERWHYATMAAIRCQACSKVSVSFNGHCGQCKCTRVEVLPAR